MIDHRVRKGRPRKMNMIDIEIIGCEAPAIQNTEPVASDVRITENEGFGKWATKSSKGWHVSYFPTNAPVILQIDKALSLEPMTKEEALRIYSAIYPELVGLGFDPPTVDEVTAAIDGCALALKIEAAL